MRIAAFIVGLVLSLVVIGASFFSLLGAGLGTVAGETEMAESFQAAGAAAFLLAIMGIIGAALTFKYRIAPLIILILVAIFLILVGMFTLYKDMAVFGVLFFLPAIFIVFSKKKVKV